MLRRYLERFNLLDFILLMFRVVVLVAIAIGIFNSVRAAKYTDNQWATLIFAGLAQGSIYALIAMGYTLVYGILLMINFAHGEIYMAGALTVVFIAHIFNDSGFLNAQPLLAILIMIVIAAAVSTILNVVVERLAYKPLRGAPRLVPLITAIGASFALQYTFRGLYGAQYRAYPEVKALRQLVTVFGYKVPLVQLVVPASALLLMLGLYFFVERTKMARQCAPSPKTRTSPA